MKTQRKIAMVVATLFLAAATGHVVQTGSLGPLGRSDTAAVQPPEMPTAVTPVAARADVALQEIAALPEFPAAPELPTRPVEMASRLPTAEGSIPDMAAAPVCGPRLSARAAPAAMIAIDLSAPCRANERVTLRHAGLVVTGRTDADGGMAMALPALESDATVTVAFTGGQQVAARADVPEAASFDRVGVQWQGRDSFTLHALEFGAREGEFGHVSAVDPRNPGWGARGAGGFLSILGNADVPLPLLAEVYSFPAGDTGRAGTVRLHLEAMVTARTCGRDMLAETLEKRGDAGVRLTDLTLSMPGCDAEGQFLVLKNLLPDLRIAGN